MIFRVRDLLLVTAAVDCIFSQYPISSCYPMRCVNHSQCPRRLAMRNSSFWLVVVAALSGLWPKAVLGDEPLGKGIELFQKHNYKAAADAFQPLTKTSRGATATYYLGLSLIQLGFNPEAEVQFRRVLTQWPGSAEAKLAAAYLDHVSPADSACAPKVPQIDLVRKAEWEALPAKCRIPIQRENGHLWVTAIINGKPCKMIFDTGAATCCLSSVDYPHVFSSRQLAQAREGKGARVYGLVPMKFLSTELTLQDITRKLEIGVIQEPGCSLIGQNFLKDYSYEVDEEDKAKNKLVNPLLRRLNEEFKINEDNLGAALDAELDEALKRYPYSPQLLQLRATQAAVEAMNNKDKQRWQSCLADCHTLANLRHPQMAPTEIYDPTQYECPRLNLESYALSALGDKKGSMEKAKQAFAGVMALAEKENSLSEKNFAYATLADYYMFIDEFDKAADCLKNVQVGDHSAEEGSFRETISKESLQELLTSCKSRTHWLPTFPNP